MNRGIEESHRAGFVTSTTVLVAGEAAADVTALPGRCPGISIGIHINLTLGTPVADPGSIPTLVGPDGRFHERSALVRLLVRRRISTADVYREARAQIDALHGLGIAPTHWDTHQHVAELPSIARAIGAAATAAGIDRARTPRVWIANGRETARVARWRWRTRNPRRMAGELARARSARALAHEFATPRYRVAASLVAVPGMPYEQRWDVTLGNLPPGICEITVHPGHVDAQLRALTPRMTTERTIDLEIATGSRVHELLAEARTVLIPFTGLPGRTSPLTAQTTRHAPVR